MRILLAEDERELSRALVAILQHEDYQVDAAFDGEEAKWLLSINDYDICLFDIMMPKLDGLTLLKEMREEGNATPVLLLTAKSEIRDRVEGLDAGANDYLPKPFAAQELLARIRALTRISVSSTGPDLSFGDISLNKASSSLVCADKEVNLTAREYQIMEMFLREPDAKFSTERIMRKVWGSLSDAETNVVWVNLSNLRKKLKELGSCVSIATLRGVGYYLFKQE